MRRRGFLKALGLAPVAAKAVDWGEVAERLAPKPDPVAGKATTYKRDDFRHANEGPLYTWDGGACGPIDATAKFQGSVASVSELDCIEWAILTEGDTALVTSGPDAGMYVHMGPLAPIKWLRIYGVG